MAEWWMQIEREDPQIVCTVCKRHNGFIGAPPLAALPDTVHQYEITCATGVGLCMQSLIMLFAVTITFSSNAISGMAIAAFAAITKALVPVKETAGRITKPNLRWLRILQGALVIELANIVVVMLLLLADISPVCERREIPAVVALLLIWVAFHLVCYLKLDVPDRMTVVAADTT